MTGSKYFASCSNEDAVYIWSIESETPLLSLPILSQVFFNLDFYKVSAGHFLVLVSSTTCLRLWLVRATKSGMQLKSSVTIPFQDGDLLSARVYKKESIIVRMNWNFLLLKISFSFLCLMRRSPSSTLFLFLPTAS